jgi:hypothetical protein
VWITSPDQEQCPAPNKYVEEVVTVVRCRRIR